MRSKITHAYYIRSMQPDQQVLEVVNRFDLLTKFNPFNRCLECNHPLQFVDKKALLDCLKPNTKKYYDHFQYCSSCDRIYWEGSHFHRMNKFIQEVIKQAK